MRTEHEGNGSDYHELEYPVELNVEENRHWILVSNWQYTCTCIIIMCNCQLTGKGWACKLN